MTDMFSHPFALWHEWASSIACLFIAASCLLLVNHMPRKRRSIEKLLVFIVAVGAMGVLISPFTGDFTDPNMFEIALRGGSAIFAVWLTWPFWCELPVLNRRQLHLPPIVERRGLPVEDSEDVLC